MLKFQLHFSLPSQVALLSCHLTDDDVSEGHDLIRRALAAHANLIQHPAQQIHHPPSWIKHESVSDEIEHCLHLYFTCHRTFKFALEDFSALIKYMEMTT